MSDSLEPSDIDALLEAAGIETSVSGPGWDPELERRLKGWHGEPPAAAEVGGTALTGQQVKTLAIDRVRVGLIERCRADGGLLGPERERIRARRGGRVAVLSGAGISVDAGFPTFRGEGGEGLWDKVDPMTLASTWGYQQNPERTLRWYCWRRSLGLPAVPTLAHSAIASAQHARADRWAGVHTQNVDGLHEAAGNRRVNRIHGSIWCWREVGTMRLVFDPSDRFEDVPRDGGGGFSHRPGVVMFGDHAPMNVYERAIAQLRACEIALVVGTSAQVSTLWPLLRTAVAAGALLVEVNPEPSEVTLELGAVSLPLASGVGVPLALEEAGALEPGVVDELARTPRTPLLDALPGLAEDFLADDR